MYDHRLFSFVLQTGPRTFTKCFSGVPSSESGSMVTSWVVTLLFLLGNGEKAPRRFLQRETSASRGSICDSGYLLMLSTSSGGDPSVCPSFGSVGRRPVSSSGMQLVSRSSGARSRYRSIAACAAYWLSIYMCRRRLSAQRAASVVWSEEDRLDRHTTCW